MVILVHTLNTIVEYTMGFLLYENFRRMRRVVTFQKVILLDKNFLIVSSEKLTLFDWNILSSNFIRLIFFLKIFFATKRLAMLQILQNKTRLSIFYARRACSHQFLIITSGMIWLRSTSCRFNSYLRCCFHIILLRLVLINLQRSCCQGHCWLLLSMRIQQII